MVTDFSLENLNKFNSISKMPGAYNVCAIKLPK